MPYRYLEDIAIADVAFRAEGGSREELFAAAAEAVTNTMVANLSAILKRESVTIELEEPTLDLLLFAFLNELVYLKDARRLLLRPASVTIAGSGPCTLAAVMTGESIDPTRHELMTDIKAVTLHRFMVAQTGGGWEAIVVLDV